ncbi:MAG TPA: DegT/DnrJ/EryC1/StrS family aminotransferase, partial [Terriglobales bacterium]|nr:DegT/DnrJ/EryC1/StrS family aminotransferase [Terriglobales bacterium]
QEAYRLHGYSQGDFPVSERLAATGISLPMFPQLTPGQQLHVATEVSRFLSGNAAEGSSVAAHNPQPAVA